jgi:L-ascorbate metabolism protein UlaG (beta-lactamase superfamily)
LTVGPVSVTYVGHATTVVEWAGTSFITDPLLTKRIARIGPKRKVEFRLDEEILRGIDFATISHGHFDHLDKRSLCKLPAGAPVVCFSSLSGIVHRSCRRTAVGIGWWESADINGVRVTGVPAFHFSARPPFHWTKDYQGYVVEMAKGDERRTVYHAGDCGMSEYFKQIGKNFSIDIAMLPIGAYDPPSFRRHHLSPEDALDAFETLGAGTMVPIHWGTFNLSWEPFDEPPRRLMEQARARGIGGKIRLLRPGESTKIG